MTGPAVLALVGDRDGPAMWRIFQPFAELQRLGYRAEWGYKDDARLATIVHRFDAVILPRLGWAVEDWEAAERWIGAIHGVGVAVIYEIDDDMVSTGFMKRLVETHGKTPEKASAVAAGIAKVIAAADGVTVSCQRLATLVRQITERPVLVVPNAIDLPWWRSVQALAQRIEPGLTIGWAGGIRPDRDVNAMAQAWGRIAKRHEGVTFVVMGHQPQAISDAVPSDRLRRIEWMPLEGYPAGYKSIDIGCCPLANEPFNRAKTPIKAFEYAASGAAVVASPTVYSQVIVSGWGGYICETVDEWEAALEALITSHSHRRIVAKRLLREVERRHSLAGNAWRWPAAWAEIIGDFRARDARRLVLARA